MQDESSCSFTAHQIYGSQGGLASSREYAASRLSSDFGPVLEDIRVPGVCCAMLNRLRILGCLGAPFFLENVEGRLRAEMLPQHSPKQTLA